MKRFLTSVLAVLLINFLFAPFARAQTADKDARSAAKVKARIMSLGTSGAKKIPDICASQTSQSTRGPSGTAQ